MKIIFGFNDIRQDGMGSEAVNLMRTIKATGIDVQPVHPWKAIDLPGYIEEFNPIFLRESNQEPPLASVVGEMVNVVNSDKQCTFFSHFGSPNWACVLPYLRSDIKVIVSVHSITPSALKIALAYKERVSAFIAISWRIEMKLRSSLPKKMHKKIQLITNAIDTSVFTPSVTYSQSDKVKILFFGRIEDITKGCDKIPKIAAYLKSRNINFQWDFYGYFHWGYESRFHLLNEKYDVQDVITYKGCLDPSDIPAILPKYDIMVMPSNHEGFGLALAEAMAAGLPCVASRIKYVTDMIMVSGREGFLVSRNDLHGFADAIVRLVSNPSLRIEIGAQARKKIVQEFDLEAQGEKYRALLESLCADEDYDILIPNVELSEFKQPSVSKPHILARILPLWLKRYLKKIV